MSKEPAHRPLAKRSDFSMVALSLLEAWDKDRGRGTKQNAAVVEEIFDRLGLKGEGRSKSRAVAMAVVIGVLPTEGQQPESIPHS